MKVTRTFPTDLSALTVGADIDFLTSYQVKRLATPASGEALRKGNKDIATAEISNSAAIAESKLTLAKGTQTLFDKINTDVGAEATTRDNADSTLSGKIDTDIATHAALFDLHTKIVRKTADQTVNNNNSPVTDNHLLMALVAGEIWLVTIYLIQQSPSTNSDFKFGWAYPSGCTIYWGADKLFTTVGIPDAWLSCRVTVVPRPIWIETTIESMGGRSGIIGVRITAIVINGGTPGNLNFQWAQNTATAEDTKVLANSVLVAHRLG